MKHGKVSHTVLEGKPLILEGCLRLPCLTDLYVSKLRTVLNVRYCLDGSGCSELLVLHCIMQVFLDRDQTIVNK